MICSYRIESKVLIFCRPLVLFATLNSPDTRFLFWIYIPKSGACFFFFFVIMRPFMSGTRALFSLISCRNAIRSRGGIGERSFISNRIGSLSGVERCSSHGSMSNEDDDARRFSLGTGRVIQRRHFLGCGDGEEGGGGELSKIYEERRVLG